MESNPKYRVWFDEVHGILKAVIKERFEVDDVASFIRELLSYKRRSAEVLSSSSRRASSAATR